MFWAAARAFELLLTVRVPGETAQGVSTQWNWFCRADALVSCCWVYFFFLSLKWTYENGCIIVRRIKVSFLSVQRCFLRWTRHQWPDIISPAHSKLNVFPWLTSLCVLSEQTEAASRKPRCLPASWLYSLLSGVQASSSVYYFKSLTFNKLKAALRRFYVYRILTTCKVPWPHCTNGWDRRSWARQVCLQHRVFLAV